MFFYTLPVIFSETDIIRPLELLLIFLAMFGILAISSPLPDLTWKQQPFKTFTLYQYLLHSWLGQMSLWQVFWPFIILLNIVIFTADTLVKSMIMSVSSWDEVQLIVFIPIVWWSGSVWRCTSNRRQKIFAAVARLTVVSVLFEVVLRIIIRKDYARIFFDCDDMLAVLDYVTCF